MAYLTSRDRDPESFISGYVDWQHPHLADRQESVDTALSEKRGMSVESGLSKTADTLGVRSAKTTNKPAVRKKAEKGQAMAELLATHPDVQNRPTGIGDIMGRYGETFGQATAKGIASAATPREQRHDKDTGEIPGTGWYFEHRRGQAASLAGSGTNLTKRQVGAMGARLSASKTPEDETAAMSGISRLAEHLGGHKVNGRRVRDIPTEELAGHASAAAAWSAHEDDLASGGGKTSRPDVPKPQAGRAAYQALRDAGRGHADNIGTAMSVARGEITPQQSFSDSTPKTSAYGEMQVQSDPGSLIEADYRNISAHYRDVTAGVTSRDQGMLMFSQNTPGERAAVLSSTPDTPSVTLPSRRSHALGSDTPTAIDTWMVAAGSGQPMASKHPETGRTYSPAKRLVDKDFPLSSSAGTKEEMGLADSHPSLDPNAAVSAQHNEAIRRLSEEHIGSISHDQFGQSIHVPSSLIQETVWTEGRRQAGADPAYNKRVRETTSAGKATARQQASVERQTARQSRPLKELPASQRAASMRPSAEESSTMQRHSQELRARRPQ